MSISVRQHSVLYDDLLKLRASIVQAREACERKAPADTVEYHIEQADESSKRLYDIIMKATGNAKLMSS